MSSTCKQPTLSIIIPAYNEAGYIAACLNSIAAQTEMPDEVIVVDNNSTDRTAEIAGRYPFVTVVREKRQGLRYSRNTGLDMARGEILGRIDADSQITPNWCQTARQAFSKIENSGIANGPSNLIDALTGPCSYHDMPFRSFGLILDRTCRTLLFKVTEPMLFGSNMLLRRTVWQAIRGDICMDGEFFEDADLSIHLQRRGYTVAFDTQLVASVSARRLDDNPVSFYKTMSMYDRTYSQHGIRSSCATGAKHLYLAGYIPLKLIRKAYDTDRRRMSASKFMRLSADQARPNSNT